MGLFGSNYERAGSGIAKNAPKKKGFFRFFEIFCQIFYQVQLRTVSTHNFSYPDFSPQTVSHSYFLFDIPKMAEVF